jgi:hypothetical protein
LTIFGNCTIDPQDSDVVDHPMRIPNIIPNIQYVNTSTCPGVCRVTCDCVYAPGIRSTGVERANPLALECLNRLSAVQIRQRHQIPICLSHDSHETQNYPYQRACSILRISVIPGRKFEWDRQMSAGSTEQLAAKGTDLTSC